MTKTKQQRGPQGIANFLKSSRGDSISWRPSFDAINKIVPAEMMALVTSLPRGGLQLAQPPRLPELFIRDYAQLHTEDRVSWQAITRKQAVNGAGVWGNAFEASRYRFDLMRPMGLQYVAAMPLAAPLLNGYPGAINLFRSELQEEFTSAELTKLTHLAMEIDKAIDKWRSARMGSACQNNFMLKTRPAVRQFIFDKDLRQLLPGSQLSSVDERIQQQVLLAAKQRLSNAESASEAFDTQRVQMTDSDGDAWFFRLTTYKSFPALSEGPVVFFCIAPACCEMGILRASDFPADNEFARLVPALKFIEDEWRRAPRLGEIARTAHLSPFHFHRRFTELMGMTPKHYMLDCQMDEAKRLLFERQKELADIAAICGFAHQSHFTSRFKQAAGLTPTRWRRMTLDRERKRLLDRVTQKN